MLSRLKSAAPIVISSIALGVSLLSLFLSQLQPARIQVYPGEVAYLMTPEDKLLTLNLYLTFVNNGATPGVVRKVAVLLQTPVKSGGYILQAAYFDRLDEEGNYRQESVVGPIPVDGHQTVNRQIRFISARGNPGDYLPLLVRGEYRATVLVWTSTDSQPTSRAAFPFVLSDRDLKKLGKMRIGSVNEAVELQIRQFQRWTAKTIDEQGVRDLLGSP